ncbi:MAG: hypothetical protein ABR597_12250, partial [Bacteroidales bacterium]
MKRFILITFIIFASIANLYSQASTQVFIGGIPGILPSPFVSDLENNFHQGQYHVQFIYTNPDPDPVEFTWHIT